MMCLRNGINSVKNLSLIESINTHTRAEVFQNTTDKIMRRPKKNNNEKDK